MDFLSKVGLILDFCDGHAVHAKDPDPTPYYMLKNVKGHFMVNIAEYIVVALGMLPLDADAFGLNHVSPIHADPSMILF